MSYFTPKISARLSPTETKNIRNKDKRVDFISLFNTDRLNENTVLEGGESLTLGADYKLSNENGEIFSLSGGTSFSF